MLTSGDKYIVRIMLRNKIYSSDGSAFESLFSDIMSKYNPKFEQVKPYGNVGDRKNDGFDKTVGEYYQVFAPENSEKQTTIGEAIKKLAEDFKGLYEHWNELCPIKIYNFVINDKYKSAPQPLHQKMLELGKAYPEIFFNILTVNKLEDYFLSLTEDDVISIVGCIANPALQLDYSALTEVLNHLMNIKGNIERTDLRNVPDFEEKIRFNGLSTQAADLLRSASYQVGSLELYFKRNSEFARSDIQKRITDCYLNACTAVDTDEEGYSDLVFFKMLEDISPESTYAVKSATLILLSYYFETCDIFERPKKDEENDSAKETLAD